jgi:serine/threonine protein phosphatase PrpC
MNTKHGPKDAMFRTYKKAKLISHSIKSKGRFGELKDSLIHDPDYDIYIVADGISSDPDSAQGSSVAVQHAAMTLRKKVLDDSGKPIDWVSEAVAAANTAVYDINLVEDGQGNPCAGALARTTIDICLISRGKLFVAHAGDGRIYLLDKENNLDLLTEDQVSGGGITCLLGCTEKMSGHKLYEKDLSNYSRILIATDGIYKPLNDNKIRSLLAAGTTVEDTLKKIGVAARSSARKSIIGEDDLTAILIAYGGVKSD